MEARLARRRYIGWKKRHRYRNFWAKALRDNSSSLLKYARRLTNGDETKAEDLLQQVFARILRYLPKPNSIRSTKHYLLRTLFTCWTRTRPRIQETSLDEAVAQVVQFPTLALELEVIMQRVVEEMSPDCPEVRIIVSMRLAGYTFKEIDEYLGRDPGYSRFIWRRFLNRLKRLLTPSRPPKANPGDEEKPAA